MSRDVIALWNFTGPQPLRAAGCGAVLDVGGGAPTVLPGGGGLLLAEGDWLVSRHPALRLGAARGFSLSVRLRRERKSTGHCEAVAGVWDEQHDARQYALFIAALNAADRAVAHISATGGTAPGHDHCRSAAIGTAVIAYGVEHHLEMRWDGTRVELLVDGRQDGAALPFSGPLFASTAPFTIGSVPRLRPPAGPGNFFVGCIRSVELRML